MSAKKPITLPALSICLPSDFKFEEFDKSDPGSLLIFDSDELNLGLSFRIIYLPDRGVVTNGDYWLENWDPSDAKQWQDLLTNIVQVTSWLSDCQTALAWARQHYPARNEA